MVDRILIDLVLDMEYMKKDLEDSFFGIPVDETLSRLFGFITNPDALSGGVCLKDSSGVQCFVWERVGKISRGLDTPQHSHDVLIGAESPGELFEKAKEVFRRFNEFGVKLNYDKVI